MDQNAKTTIAHLPLVRLVQMPVPAVDIEAQRRIAARLKVKLAEVETAHQATQAQLREIERLPEKLLAQAFGQKEIP